ncbi:MAG: Type I secretion target GGXGXDXXX repeat protein [uncultured bacterium]|nr:MAG: Type I secretion target GGXGXDXXX repeat protein [uncultured bacterium]
MEFSLTGETVTPTSGAETTGVEGNFLNPPLSEIVVEEVVLAVAPAPVVVAVAAPAPVAAPAAIPLDVPIIPPPPPPPPPPVFVPVAGDEERTLNEANFSEGTIPDAPPTDTLSTSGDLVDLGVDFGGDGPGGLTFVNFDGTDTETIPINGDSSASVNVTGEFGLLVVRGDGTWTYSIQHEPDIFHDNPNATGADDIQQDLFTFTVIDANGDADTGSLAINILDDGPVATGAEIDRVVEEEALSPESTTLSEITITGATTSSVDQWHFHHDGGALTIDLLSELGSPSFVNLNDDGTQGNLDTYIRLFVDDGSLDAGDLIYSNDDSNPALSGDGSTHSFDSFLSIGALPAGDYILAVGDFELTTAEAIAGANTDDTSVEHGPYQITLTGAVTITDIPIGGYVTSMPSLSDGNQDQDDGPEDATQPDSAVVTGSFASLVTVGADDPGTFSILSTDDLPPLLSQGDSITYEINGDTIEAWVRFGGEVDEADRLVFTLEVQTDGEYTFTLLDQLDHVPPEGVPADENIGLISGDGSVNFIDFSTAIQVTDTDGDSISFTPGTLTFTVVDDIPAVGTPQDSLMAIEKDNTLTASLDILGSGADEPQSITLKLTEGEAVRSIGGNQLTSGGNRLYWHENVDDSWSAVTLQSGEPNPNAKSFTISVDETAGTYTVLQNGILDGNSTVETIDFSESLSGGNKYEVIFGDGTVTTNGSTTTYSNGVFIWARASLDLASPFGVDGTWNRTTVNYSNEGVGVENGDMIDGTSTNATRTSDILSIKFFSSIKANIDGNGQNAVVVDANNSIALDLTAVTLVLDHLGAAETAYYTLWNNGSQVGIEYSISGIDNGTGASADTKDDLLHISTGDVFDEIRLESGSDGSNAYRIESAEISVLHEGTDSTILVPVEIEDADGDIITTDFSVTFDGKGALDATSADAADGDTSYSGMVISGSTGNDTIIGTNYSDTIDGRAGNDTISGGGGADTLHGGEGSDTLSYADDTNGVTVNLTTSILSGGEAQGDSIDGFENVTGGAGNDTLTGDDTGNTLSGGGGNDILVGNIGDDVIFGGTGTDDLTGGTGNDQLVGGDGIDTLSGGDGNDVLVGDDVNFDTPTTGTSDIVDDGDTDIVSGGGGTDTAGDPVTPETYNDVIENPVTDIDTLIPPPDDIV